MWFRRDLRIGDNPALGSAIASGNVLPLFVIDPRFGKATDTQSWRGAGSMPTSYTIDPTLRGHV
jgi:deoxyribodipyrimidine photolyase